MNILYDFITVKWFTGAGEYQRRVFQLLLERKCSNKIYALWDSSVGICYSDLHPSILEPLGINFVDVNNANVAQIVKQYNIDLFFIAAGQFLNGYDGISDVDCKTICIIHDIAGEEIWDNNLSFAVSDSTRKIRNHLIKRAIGKEKKEYHLQNIYELYKKNDNCIIVTPSEYTKYSLCYHYPFNMNRIIVAYSPYRIMNRGEYIENSTLKELVYEKKKYYLFLNAGRSQKNPGKVLRAFEKFSKLSPDSYLVTVQYSGDKQFPNHIIIPFLSESDLGFAYENAYALIYASIYEGFGYPPVEIMRYGKPVFASNVTSIPEILGDAPIYFSPFYPSDIFKALLSLSDKNYVEISQKSFDRYENVLLRQNQDLSKIVDLIVG